MVLHAYSQLKKMEVRPAMWTGEPTLRSIRIFIDGYCRALLDHGRIPESAWKEPFHDWVAKRLGYYASTAGWVNMILAHSMGLDPQTVDWAEFIQTPVTNGQHEASVRLFYQLLEEFRAEVDSPGVPY
jgi:hypothetical protein